MENESIESWEVLKTDYPLNHPWCKIRRDQIKFPNGLVDDYYLNELPEVVLVFPVTRERNVVFVRQYKHGAGKILLELPGGCFTPGKELPENAIRRELKEETGMVAEEWIALGKMYENPTKATNEVHLFLATGVEKIAEQKLDETENIEVVEYPLAEVMNMVEDGRICASTSLALTFRALARLKEMPFQ